MPQANLAFLLTLSLPDLRRRQEIVETQQAEAFRLAEQGRAISDETFDRWQQYQNTLFQAVASHC